MSLLMEVLDSWKAAVSAKPVAMSHCESCGANDLPRSKCIRLPGKTCRDMNDALICVECGSDAGEFDVDGRERLKEQREEGERAFYGRVR